MLNKKEKAFPFVFSVTGTVITHSFHPQQHNRRPALSWQSPFQWWQKTGNLLSRLLNPRNPGILPAGCRRSVSGEATSTVPFFSSPYILSPAGVKVVDPRVLSPLPHCLVPLRKGERVRVCVRLGWTQERKWGRENGGARVRLQRVMKWLYIRCSGNVGDLRWETGSGEARSMNEFEDLRVRERE